MASTYVNDLRLEEMATGDQSGSWGTTTNTNLELIAEALGYGTEGITTNADTHTTTVADGATDPGRSMYIEYTGTLDSACTITIAPNTVNRMHFIENGTSGSQNIIIKQGSGATITIPPGDVKAVYLDGAGSGAKVVDAFASLNVVDLKVQDDLTVTDDVAIGGDIDLEGSIDVNGTANLDVVDIDGAVDMATTLAVAGNVDFNGDLDVDGTTNLDVVDIDGAVDMASTLAVAGVLTANAGVVVDNITIDGTQIDLSSGDLTLDVAGKILLSADDAGTIQLFDGSLHYGSISEDNSNLIVQSIVQDEDILFRGDDGGTVITALTLDMSAAGAATFNSRVTSAGITTTAGSVFEGGIEVGQTGTGTDAIVASFTATNGNNIATFRSTDTNHGFKIQSQNNGYLSFNSGADLTIDAVGAIILDADGGDVQFKDNGTSIGAIINNNSDFVFRSLVSDKDVLIKGLDGSSVITACTFDMSDAGSAFFNNDIYVPDQIIHTGDTNTYMQFHGADSWRVVTGGHERMNIIGASVVFNDDSNDQDFRVESNDKTHMLFVDGGNNKVKIATVDTLYSGGETMSVQCGSSEGIGMVTSGASKQLLGLYNAADSGTRYYIRFAVSAGGAEVGKITSDGSNITYATSSDARLKDVTGIARGLEVINELNPVAYNWKSSGNADEGLIAQEVQDIVPNAVVEGEEDEMYCMDYSKLVVHLVAGMKEQQTLIESLTARITTLEGK